LDIIDFIDCYFSDQNNDFDINTDEKTILQIIEDNPFFSKFSQFIDERKKKFKKFNRLPTTLSIFDYVFEVFYESILIFIEFLRSLDDFTLIQDSLEHIRLKIDDFISSYGFIHTQLYKKISIHLENLITRYLGDLNQSLDYYFNLMNKSLPINSKFQTIMIIVEINTYIKAISDKIPIAELEFLSEIDLYQKLNRATKKKLEQYFYNWCLNLANLIEDNFKPCIFTLLIIRDLINNQSIPDLTKFDLKEKSLGYIYNMFGIVEDKYKNINLLLQYRNAISHTRFKFSFKQNWNESFIIFKDLNKPQFEKTNEQFIIDYFKLLKFVFTCNFSFMIFSFRCQNEGKPLLETIKEELFPLINQSSEEMEKFKSDITKLFKEIKKNKDNIKQVFKKFNS